MGAQREHSSLPRLLHGTLYLQRRGRLSALRLACLTWIRIWSEGRCLRECHVDQFRPDLSGRVVPQHAAASLSPACGAEWTHHRCGWSVLDQERGLRPVSAGQLEGDEESYAQLRSPLGSANLPRSHSGSREDGLRSLFEQSAFSIRW